MFVATHTDLARLYLTVVACGEKPAGFEDVLRQPTLELVTAAMRTTDADGALTPERATDHVLVAAIGATLRHPGDGPSGAAEAALRFLGHRPA